MYLLRFSDTIDRMKYAYGNFFIQSQSRNEFFTRGKSVSSNQKSAVKMNQSVRKRAHIFVNASSIFILRSLKSFRNCAVSIFDVNEFNQARKFLEARSKRLKKAKQ